MKGDLETVRARIEPLEADIRENPPMVEPIDPDIAISWARTRPDLRRKITLRARNNAQQPAIYENAVHALSECYSIDEAKVWSDKYQALASYAKQAKDDRLLNLARRIQARAIRRCGELLREIEPKQGANQNIKDGDGPNVRTRKQATTDAGLSERQAKTALSARSLRRGADAWLC
jgi:hypothetical protein